MARFLVGIGNWNMSDDSIGLLLAEHFAQKGCPGGYEPVGIHGDGMQLLFHFESSTEDILLVDAVEMGKKAGEWVLFTPDEVESRKTTAGISSHEGDVLRIVALGRELGYPVPPIRIFGIQPGEMGWGEMTEAVAGRFEEYLELLKGIMEKG